MVKQQQHIILIDENISLPCGRGLPLRMMPNFLPEVTYHPHDLGDHSLLFWPVGPNEKSFR